MKVNRRRFLSVVAASGAVGIAASVTSRRTEWRGRAMGADVNITIEGEGTAAQAAITAARDAIRRMERHFSIYDPGSALSRLNRTGVLRMPAEFARLVNITADVNRLTEGLFDPTIQPVFSAIANSSALPPAKLVGWKRVEVEGQNITLPERGMALTFNGIAQGYATDRVSEVLKAHGFDRVLVNVGEYRAGASAAQIGIADHEGQLIGETDLRECAIATSSPAALVLPGGAFHIFRPDLALSRPRWRTVSAIAEAAAVADGISTALALTADTRLAERLVRQGSLERVFLEDTNGEQRWIG